jgi:hypothetical protein
MLQRSADGLCSHIFFGNCRKAAESSYGPRPKDSSIRRLSSRVMDTYPHYPPLHHCLLR